MEDKKKLKVCGMIALAVSCIIAVAALLDHFFNRKETEE
jgi:hypothetical protein